MSPLDLNNVISGSKAYCFGIIIEREGYYLMFQGLIYHLKSVEPDFLFFDYREKGKLKNIH